MYCIFRSDEGEIRNDAYTLYGYLQLPDLNFASFTGMILAMSRAHSASDREAVSGLWLNSSKNLGAVCRDFLTGSPNYCYPLGKTLEYRKVEIGSSVSVTAASDTKKTGSSQKNKNRPFEPVGFICIFC